jgi:tRNA-2-methylthio-N6-dimethylallyladenosine synthase
MTGTGPHHPHKTLYIKSYGCQMNMYDATRMADVLKPFGYALVQEADSADLVLFNTCHIREKASEKLYSDLGRMREFQKRRALQGANMRIGVAGCVAQAEGVEVLRRAPYVSLVFGPQVYHLLPRMLAQLEAGAEKQVLLLDFPAESKFDFLPEETMDKGPVSFLSVQEGCDKFCTYCCVPYTRGMEVSRPISGVLAEARRLVSNGAKEIMLLGQNVSAYHGLGPDGKEWGLGRLLRQLAEDLSSYGLKRLRYTTSHPNDMQDELIEAHRDLDLLMPFLHLPVQSGSDKVLKEMNRKNTHDSYLRLIERFRNARPDLALASDFIVGFPGETDDDFKETLRIVREVKYAQAYSFKYSPRPGTPAAERSDQVPESVKNDRLQTLQALINQQQYAFNKDSEGEVVDVLIERPGTKPQQWVGRSPYMQSVHVVAPDARVGDLVPVSLIEGLPNSMRGELILPLSSTSAAV